MNELWGEHEEVRAFYSDNDHCIWKPELPGGVENLCFLAEYCTVDDAHIIRTSQTHSSTVRVIRGPESYKDYKDDTISIKPDGIDGLVTNVPGTLLTVLSADCVPVLMYDPKKKVIAALHSGWRGTCNEISGKMIDIMKEEYGCNPADILVLIGPHICDRHYEVGPELQEHFRLNYSESELEGIFSPGAGDKFYLNMSVAITATCIRLGLPKGNITDTNICTYEREDLSSYRRTGSTTDRILTGIMLRSSI